MTSSEHNNDADRAWQTLVTAARQAPSEAMPALDADRVLQAALGARCPRPQPPSTSDERLVSWAAAFALAASLLLTMTCWSDVVAAWSPRPTIFDLAVDMEPVR